MSISADVRCPYKGIIGAESLRINSLHFFSHPVRGINARSQADQRFRARRKSFFRGSQHFPASFRVSYEKSLLSDPIMLASPLRAFFQLPGPSSIGGLHFNRGFRQL